MVVRDADVTGGWKGGKKAKQIPLPEVYIRWGVSGEIPHQFSDCFLLLLILSMSVYSDWAMPFVVSLCFYFFYCDADIFISGFFVCPLHFGGSFLCNKVCVFFILLCLFTVMLMVLCPYFYSGFYLSLF
jgi:hypothetical protein